MLSLLLIGFCFLSFAQDEIIKRDGTKIRSIVIEITRNNIKYRLFDQADGPIRNIDISEVFIVEYKDGKIESFEKKPVSVSYNTDYNSRDYFLGVGVGNSYGGFGIKGQYRTGGKVGFGAHIGVGYAPGGVVEDGKIKLVSGTPAMAVGLAFYPYKWLYIDAQAGVTDVETYSHYRYYNGGSQAVWGVSALVGGEWVWGEQTGFGFNTAIGSSLNFGTENNYYSLAMDLGFIIRF